MPAVLVRHPDPTKDLEYLKTRYALGLPVDVDYLFELVDTAAAAARADCDQVVEEMEVDRDEAQAELSSLQDDIDQVRMRIESALEALKVAVGNKSRRGAVAAYKAIRDAITDL